MDWEITEHIKSSVQILKDHFKNDYRFLSVATEKQIEGFEEKFSVKIPEDLRWFLLNIANGVETNDVMHSDIFRKIDFSDHYFEEDIYNPSLPFKLTEALGGYPHEMEDFNNGILELAGYGCGCYSFLVINGEEYGHIWTDNYASNSEVYPEKTSTKSRIMFHEWLRKEIEQNLSRKEHSEKQTQHRIQEEKANIVSRYEEMKMMVQAESPKESRFIFLKG